MLLGGSLVGFFLFLNIPAFLWFNDNCYLKISCNFFFLALLPIQKFKASAVFD